MIRASSAQKRQRTDHSSDQICRWWSLHEDQTFVWSSEPMWRRYKQVRQADFVADPCYGSGKSREDQIQKLSNQIKRFFRLHQQGLPKIGWAASSFGRHFEHEQWKSYRWIASVPPSTGLSVATDSLRTSVTPNATAPMSARFISNLIERAKHRLTNRRMDATVILLRCGFRHWQPRFSFVRCSGRGKEWDLLDHWHTDSSTVVDCRPFLF